MFKRFILLFSCCVLLLIPTSSVFAANGSSGLKNEKTPTLNKSEQAEVEKLLDQLVQERLLKNHYGKQNNLSNVQELAAQEKDLWKELNMRGVKLATQDELNTISKNSTSAGEMSLMSTPPTWGPYPYVDMLSYGQKTITVNNKTYTLWIFYAIPKDGGGAPLSKFFNPVDLLKSNSFSWSDFAQKLFDIYVQKAIGAVKAFTWVPYELFWSGGGPNFTSFNRYDLSVTYASRMKYVWQYLPTTDGWQLKASSNNVSLNEVHTTRGIKNGAADSITASKTNVVYADQYDNVETLAVTGSGYSTWPVQTITYKDVSGGTALSFYPYYASYAPDLAG